MKSVNSLSKCNNSVDLLSGFISMRLGGIGLIWIHSGNYALLCWEL